MKIAILTHPLRVNYGGLLQAYALKSILEREGYDVFHLQLKGYQYNVPNSFCIYTKAILKYLLYYKRHISFHTLLPISRRTMQRIRINTDKFKKKLNIKYYYRFDASLSKDYDIFIVGSDQVWRPGFTPNIYNYYLDFVSSKDHKKIAYAASLGIDYWPYNAEETYKIRNLIKDFSFASVREFSAKELYKHNLSIELPVVIDPTLLLTMKDYQSLFHHNSQSSKEYIAIYLLNEKKEKEVISIFNETSYKLVNLMPNKRIKYKTEKFVDDAIYMSPEDWLSKIFHAKYVITDSFHGTVFSIIFNKQFIVLPHLTGGNSRINTLLQILNLEDRFSDNLKTKAIMEILHRKIEYNIINKKIEELRNYSYNLLINSLK